MASDPLINDPLTSMVNENISETTEESSREEAEEGGGGEEEEDIAAVTGKCDGDEGVGGDDDGGGGGGGGGGVGGGVGVEKKVMNNDARSGEDGLKNRAVGVAEGGIAAEGQEEGRREGVEDSNGGGGGGGAGGVEGAEGGEGDEQERALEEMFSEINLITPPADKQGLEFFDHNVTSSDSSDVRVRSVRLDQEEGTGGGDGGGRGDGGGGGEGRTKSSDRQRDTAKLLDLESPVDARREVSGEETEDYRDLKATISLREKQGSRTDSFINFKIVTQTTRPSHLYEKSNYEVWRRYRDFEWLRTQIERAHPTLIIPPLPGKQVARYFDHMSEIFLVERQRALDKFLWRLTIHPYFSFNSDLKVFLTATPEEFSSHVQESQGRQKLMNRLSSSVRQAHTSLMLKDGDPHFAKQLAYFSELGEKTGILERIGARLHAEREELRVEMDDFSVAVFHWATNEQVMTQPLQKLANCMEKCSNHLKSLNDANTYSMMVAVREYQLYSSSAIAALRRRDTLQFEMERSGIDRERKKRNHTEATASGKVQKVMKLADELEKTELAAEKASDSLSQANEELRVDLEKWHGAKNKEVCHVLRQFASNHVDYHQKCFDEWESALKRLRSASVSPSPSPAASTQDDRHHRLATLTSSSRDSDSDT